MHLGGKVSGLVLTVAFVATSALADPTGVWNERGIVQRGIVHEKTSTKVDPRVVRHLDSNGIPRSLLVLDASHLLGGEVERFLESKGFGFEGDDNWGIRYYSSGLGPVRVGGNGQRVSLMPRGGVRLATYICDREQNRVFHQVIELDKTGKVLGNELVEDVGAKCLQASFSEEF